MSLSPPKGTLKFYPCGNYSYSIGALTNWKERKLYSRYKLGYFLFLEDLFPFISISSSK